MRLKQQIREYIVENWTACCLPYLEYLLEAITILRHRPIFPVKKYVLFLPRYLNIKVLYKWKQQMLAFALRLLSTRYELRANKTIKIKQKLSTESQYSKQQD